MALSSDPAPAVPLLLGLVPPDGSRPALVVVPLVRHSTGEGQQSATDGGKAVLRSAKLTGQAGSGGGLTALLPRLPAAGVYRVLIAHDRAGLQAQLEDGCVHYTVHTDQRPAAGQWRQNGQQTADIGSQSPRNSAVPLIEMEVDSF